MKRPGEGNKELIDALQERAKELNCLYRVDEILSRGDTPEDTVMNDLLAALPPGWQFPEICRARIVIRGRAYEPPDYRATPWTQRAPIALLGDTAGEVAVGYTEERPAAADGPFLDEEKRLIRAIAERIGMYLLQRRLRRDHQSWESALKGISTDRAESWRVLLDFLARTDRNLLSRITRKMANQLLWNDVPDAERLLRDADPPPGGDDGADGNRPLERQSPDSASWTRRVFDLAARYLSGDDIVASIQSWINEDNSVFLIKSLENPGTGLAELSEAVVRFRNAAIDESRLSPAVRLSLKVALLRRFFVDQLEFLQIAKPHVDVRDFYDLVERLIYPPRSQGKLGGKAAGLFLAKQILDKSPEYANVFADFRFPRTWYVASDAMLDFIQYNTLNEVYNQKYMDIERVRRDYPRVIQLFKNSRFTPEIEKGLALALDDFEDRPLIVRSSSILEDRVGSSFSGKYKSLFLANQGAKRERLEALKDAIAEIYASVFSPDPIVYRTERGLLDFREEMGVLIEEVVGVRAGRYYLPAFSGVAFGNNEVRWSPRLKREDGLLRMVPGLGTRAVDRVGDDYPVMVSPGNPGLRLNQTLDETVRYAPRRIDVIDLEAGRFETLDLDRLLREIGPDYPMIRELAGIVDADRVRTPVGLEPRWGEDRVLLTFQGLMEHTPFIHQMHTLLKLFREKLGGPVDIEFACDGEHVYILQCRTQSQAEEHRPAAIPRDLPADRVLFTSRRHVSNGRVPDLTHLVYVDPAAYAALPDPARFHDVARAVGRVNKLLPKRRFALIGPGRWGSRGDIRLGVGVTYADISNTAMLIEVARAQGDYAPEPSFGTHFFQDLVEADIRYLALFPDDPGTVFREAFFRHARNMLGEILPEFAHLAEVVRVIDVPGETHGRVLRVLLNADLEEAVAVFDKPREESAASPARGGGEEAEPENHWWWRMRMARRIAAHVDAERLGVKAMYVFGSTKNASAGPASDIDLLVHVAGGADRDTLATWLDGWSAALAETNYLRTGYRSDGLLDVHFITDEDIARETSYAVKINAVTDAAWPLPLGRDEDDAGDG